MSRKVPLKLEKIEQGIRLQFQHLNWRGTCIGDSGGPGYIQRPSGEIELIGIVSGVIGTPCSPSSISVHTWLYPHLDWIQSFLKNNFKIKCDMGSSAFH